MNAPEHVAPPPNATAVALLPIAEIMASRSNPRKHFDDTYIAELADSIKAHGLIQPITVRQARVRGADKATKTRSIRTILLPDEAHAATRARNIPDLTSATPRSAYGHLRRVGQLFPPAIDNLLRSLRVARRG